MVNQSPWLMQLVCVSLCTLYCGNIEVSHTQFFLYAHLSFMSSICWNKTKYLKKHDTRRQDNVGMNVCHYFCNNADLSENWNGVILKTPRENLFRNLKFCIFSPVIMLECPLCTGKWQVAKIVICKQMSSWTFTNSYKSNIVENSKNEWVP
jgi:hypothetical protein